MKDFKKVNNHILTNLGFKLLSRWTSSQSVEFDDGETAQEKVSAMEVDIAGKIPTSQKGVANGVATLGSDGKVPVDQIPKTALDHLITVQNDTARFALTTAQCQNGDTVKVTDDGTGHEKMYLVIDDTKLNSEDGYQAYAASAYWSTIQERPTDIVYHDEESDVTIPAGSDFATQSQLNTHANNTSMHVTSTEKSTWNSKLSTTSNTANNTVTFTSGDNASPTSWTNVSVLTSGEKHSSILNKISTMFKNVRYLYKMLGTTNISSIGDGTVTGGLSTLNTNLFPTGTTNTTVFFGVQDNNVGSQTIPLQNADQYNISISGITKFGTPSVLADASGWTINKNKNGFSIEKNSSYYADFFGNQHAGKLFVVRFTVSRSS